MAGDRGEDLAAGAAQAASSSASTRAPRLRRSVCLVGLMGAGKSTVGRRLAERIGVDFHDSDQEIERAAQMSVPEIFERYGEDAFRDAERRVIARLLDGPPVVLATGGGAFVNRESRRLMKERTHVLWLRAALDTLVERCGRQTNRPLLKTGDPREILRGLMETRHPIYAEAHSVVESCDGPHERVVSAAMAALSAAGVASEMDEERRDG